MTAKPTPRHKRKPSSLDAHAGYWLRYVSNQVSHSFSLKLAVHDVTVAEWVVMRELYDSDSFAPSALADRIGMTRGAISKLADRLIAKDLVRRTLSDIDRRYQALALTGDGRALVPKLAAVADENDTEYFGHLKMSERQRLKETMQEIVRLHGLKSVPVE